MEDCCVCKEPCDKLISSFYGCKCKSTLHQECYAKLTENDRYQCIICRQVSIYETIPYKVYKEFKFTLTCIKMFFIGLMTTIVLYPHYNSFLALIIAALHYARWEVDLCYCMHGLSTRYKSTSDLFKFAIQSGITHYKIYKSVILTFIHLVNQQYLRTKFLEIIKHPKDREMLTILNEMEHKQTTKDIKVILFQVAVAIYVLCTFDCYQIHSLYYIIYLAYDKLAPRINNAV